MKKLQRYRKWIFVLLGVLFVSIFGYYFQNNASGNIISFSDNPDGNVSELDYASGFQYKDAGVPSVSMAFKDKTIFAAYYSILYYIDLEKGQSGEISCPEGYFAVGSNENSENKEFWNPTGICYEKTNDLFYIANYHGSNVLVCKIDDNFSVKVIKVISDSDMVSPENVYVKNHKIAAADYDGNKLFLFDEDGKLEWKKETGLAHGVAMSQDRIFVTSLKDRKVVSYDYEGNFIKEMGQLGYVGADSFMWPTGLEYYEEGSQVLVTDAHTGRIYCFDENLEYQSSIGGNGPSNNAFNFPYSAVIYENHIYVSDVFNGRILALNFKGEITHIYGEKINGIPDGLVVHPYEQMPYSYGMLSDIDSKVFHPYLDAKVISGYSSLYFQNSNGDIRQINYSQYLQNGEYLDLDVPKIFQPYCTFVYDFSFEKKQYYFILSPQSDRQYLIYDVTDKICFLYSDVSENDEELCIWNVDGQWYSRIAIEEKFKEVIKESGVYIDAFLKQAEKGQSRQEAYETVFLDFYNQHFQTSMTIGQFHQWIEKWFTSEAGREFWRCVQSEGNMEKAAQEYFKKTYDQAGETYLCEMLFVQMFGKDS